MKHNATCTCDSCTELNKATYLVIVTDRGQLYDEDIKSFLTLEEADKYAEEHKDFGLNKPMIIKGYIVQEQV